MPPIASLRTLKTRFFTRFIRLELGLAESTDRAYGKHVDQALNFIADELERAPRLADLTHDHLQAFLSSEIERGLAPQTVLYKKAALFNFCRCLRRKRFIADDPTKDLLVPRPRPPLPAFLTQADAETIVAAPLTLAKTELLGIRDHAIHWLLYEPGLREMEVAGMKLTGLHWNLPKQGELLITVLGKRGKPRRVPVRRAIEPLKAWLARRGELAKGEDTVFLSMGGGPMTPGAVGHIVPKYGALVGVRAWAHLMRHTAATLMLLSGGELRAVQEMLGHDSPLTTARYAHVTLQHVVEQALDYHPANGRAKGRSHHEAIEELRQLIVLHREEVAAFMKMPRESIAGLRDDLMELKDMAKAQQAQLADLHTLAKQLAAGMAQFQPAARRRKAA